MTNIYVKSVYMEVLSTTFPFSLIFRAQEYSTTEISHPN